MAALGTARYVAEPMKIIKLYDCSLYDLPTQQVPAFPVDALPRIANGLTRIGHARRARHMIHGDFTNHNVLVDGGSSPCGTGGQAPLRPWQAVSAAAAAAARLHV